MTKDVYFYTEAIGAIIMLILLYANIFEQKQHTRKRDLFARLLVFNIIVVLADAVTWLDLGWEKAPYLFWGLIALTYILPFVMLGTFSKYLYEHISEKANTSIIPYNIVFYGSILAAIASFFLCISGRMFSIAGGVFEQGPAENIYYSFYILSLVFFTGVTVSNGKELGKHDLIAALSFFLVPALSVIFSVANPDFNLAVPLMAVDMLVIYIFLQSERESALLYQSNNDELTGVYNRREYENDRMIYPLVPPEPGFVYASIDINGLKETNDNLGHAAGDELIKGASYCLKRTLGNYGKIYRTGGDEFVAIFFIDPSDIDFLIDDFKAVTHKWQGEMVKSLSMSLGYACKWEYPELSVDEMAKIADERMYEDKRAFYANKGIDRRAQSDAINALCKIYTKILKINLTNDSYSIISMDYSEKTQEMGFSKTISGWLKGFCEAGLVHEDDIEGFMEKMNLEYLKNHFREEKTTFTIIYRRKYADGFRKVSMEMIPANDYSDDNQSVFLYVKNIEM